MKQTYLICLLFVSLFSSAQIINIPDANFKAKLLEASPSNYIAKNLSGANFKIDSNNDNEIQTTEALQVSELNVVFSNISSLLGISDFINIKKIHCDSNQIISLDLQSLLNLEILNCTYNQLTSLNVQGLTNIAKINCGNNQLTSLNLSGLTSLYELRCYYNQISNLNINSTHLNRLECNFNLLTSLDLTNQTLLQYLVCNNNNLSSLNLDYLQNVTYFICGNNQLSSLNLNNMIKLTRIDCNDNLLTTLDIGLTKIFNLNCSNNQLISMFIKNGQLENPLNFYNNPNLQYICGDDGQLTDIQNAINVFGYSNCNVNSYCSFTPGGQFYTIQGQQKFDNENDGCDVSDSHFTNLKYSITNSITTGTIISNNTGSYSIPVQAGQHTVTPILENPNYFIFSPTNVIVNFPAQTSPVTQNFCITPNGIHNDVEVSIIPTNPARPGFDAKYKIIYKNKGNQTENGTINLEFNDAILDVVSTNPVFTSQTLNNLSFNYSNLNPFETREISVVLNVNSPMETPAVISGDILNYTVTNTITNTDEMLFDNTFVFNQTVVNSYDPNDKTCLQGNYVGPDKIGNYVHYMIRFENTGTFPAENIVVKDMIDTAKFDVSSLVPLHASHNYFTRISGNKVEFIFENINLPFDDANNDGYIAFKIKTLPSLVLGDTFSNSANIYFDYNFPIVTNTATTTIAALSNPSFEFANYFSLYPNPTTNELNINLKSAIEINSIQIYNTIGQLVTVQTGNALKIDVSNLKTGNHFIKINTNEGFSTSQFIKE
jgi:Leucine-rich repeat (LRR) protein